MLSIKCFTGGKGGNYTEYKSFFEDTVSGPPRSHIGMDFLIMYFGKICGPYYKKMVFLTIKVK